MKVWRRPYTQDCALGQRGSMVGGPQAGPSFQPPETHTGPWAWPPSFPEPARTPSKLSGLPRWPDEEGGVAIPVRRAWGGELGTPGHHLPNEEVWPLLLHGFTSVKTPQVERVPLLLGKPQAQYGPPAPHPCLTGKQPAKVLTLLTADSIILSQLNRQET